MSRFQGKVAIVTGASTGLGPIMAQMLADEGAKLVLAARRRNWSKKPPTPSVMLPSRCRPMSPMKLTWPAWSKPRCRLGGRSM